MDSTKVAQDVAVEAPIKEVLKPVDKTQQEVNETVKNGAGDAPVVKKPADSPIKENNGVAAEDEKAAIKRPADESNADKTDEAKKQKTDEESPENEDNKEESNGDKENNADNGDKENNADKEATTETPSE